MINIPPGLGYLAHVLPLLTFPSLFVYGILSYLPLRQGFPTWLSVVISLLAQPFALSVVYLCRKHLATKDAHTRGAVIMPQVQDKWPGGLTLLSELLTSFKDGYPGTGI